MERPPTKNDPLLEVETQFLDNLFEDMIKRFQYSITTNKLIKSFNNLIEVLNSHRLRS